MGLDQRFEPFVHWPLVGARFFGNDQKVRDQPVHAPVGVRLEHLPDQADVTNLVDGNQGNWQVSRDPVLPEAGLAFDVFFNPLCG